MKKLLLVNPVGQASGYLLSKFSTVSPLSLAYIAAVTPSDWEVKIADENFGRLEVEDADLVVAKGQGNYETLSDVNKNVFFVLKAKCPVIARDLGCEVGEMILQKSNSFKSVDNLIKETE